MGRNTEEHKRSSSALRANMPLTRQEVTVPPEYEVLLTAVAEYHGVRVRVANLLQEYFHPMRNLDVITTGLRNVCGSSMFHYYEKSAQRAECARLYVKLFSALYEEDAAREILGKIFRTNLDFMLILLQSSHRSEYGESTNLILDNLIDVFSRRPEDLLTYSNTLRNAGTRFEGSEELVDKFNRLYKACVVEGLKVFKEKVDFQGWFREYKPELKERYNGLFEKLEKDYIGRTLKNLEESTDREFIFAQPNLDDLVNFSIKKINKIENPVHRTEFYVYLASIGELGYRDMDILRGLYNSLMSVCSKGGEEDIVLAVNLVTRQLKISVSGQKHTLFTCLERLGKEISGKDNKKLTDYFIEKVIDTGFESPGIRGVSEEWQTQLNQHHLECVRTWLSIIEEDPISYKQLMSALIINLHYRGIFVSDTDLFQRDVSELLNSGVAGVLNLTTQLVSMFPVFFNDIGSEGELREVSTRVDQIIHRQDPLVHFLRKQSHAESNNRLVGFARGVLQYWRDGGREVLKPYLPGVLYESLAEESPFYQNAHSTLKQLESGFGTGLADLETMPYEKLEKNLSSISDVPQVEKERIVLMVRFYRLLKDKYTYSSDRLIQDLGKSSLITAQSRQEFAQSCRTGDSWQIVRAGNRVLLELRQNITDPGVTKADESIYHKRHIAAGIPSMYGSYREPKFDSMGILIRVMTFVKKHLEEVVAGFNFRYITRGSMRDAYEIMQQMLLGLKVCGLAIEDLSTKVELLKRSISVGNFSASQYLNIFEFISRAVSDIVESSFIAVHNANLKTITRQVLRENGCPEGEIDEKADEMSEEFLRWIISTTYSIQEFDLFLTKILQSFRSMTKILDDRSTGIILNYNPGKLITFINEPLEEYEDQLYLGYKGYALKKLKALQLPIPDGFIVSTELFNVLPAMSYEDLRRDTRERVIPALRRIEKLTGGRLGDPGRPLLLSVRSGAAFSMPGMMDTILNVGMNDEFTEELSKKPNFGWTSWDCYRRFLQNWAMSCGLDRNMFDDIMIRFKEKYKVTRKLQFTPIQMREMAFEYKSTATKHGVNFIDDPIDQLMRSIFLVLRSWDSETAKVYRKQMQLSDDWGTGVIVQKMVLGNLNYDSGTGVIFTRNPREFASGIDLFGDFVMCSQGEDVVAGLVNPYPIGEKQRLKYSPDLNISLEKIYPEAYARLKEAANMLINRYGYGHQEIEFTFESSKPEDLFILQTKPMSMGAQDEIPVFENPEEVQRNLLGTGVGVSGGAMSGLVAFTEDDIASLRASQPGENIILLRPDTVPEDISLVLAVDGLLTGRGGATSHASVTAKRIGKTCVVNCAHLVVSETNKYAKIGSQELRPGDMISIDGHSGFVVAGKHEVKEYKEEILPF